MAPPARAAVLRWMVFVAAALPLAWLYWAWQAGGLGVFPEERVLHLLGRWGLLLLLLTLALGPAFRLSGWRGFMAVRRQLGLWAFTYLGLHMLAWLGLDQGWQWEFIVAELQDLPYLQVGLLSFLLLVPLALTSVPQAQRLLGLRRWQWLHRLSYVAAAGGLLHFWMLSRALQPELILAAVLLVTLVLFRLADGWLRRG